VAIDLFRIRCAVAALVVCVDHGGLLTVAGVRRTDLAVRTLSHVEIPSGSALRAAIDRLLSPADDSGGVRTLGAIEEMAALTHVDTDSAPLVEPPRPTIRPLSLCGPGPYEPA